MPWLSSGTTIFQVNLRFHKAVSIFYMEATTMSNKNLSSIGIQLSKLSYYQLIKLEFRIIIPLFHYLNLKVY